MRLILFICALLNCAFALTDLNTIVQRASELRQSLKERHIQLTKRERELADEEVKQKSELDKLTRSLNERFETIKRQLPAESEFNLSFIQRHSSKESSAQPRSVSAELARAQQDRQDALNSLHGIIGKMHQSLAKIKKSMIQTTQDSSVTQNASSDEVDAVDESDE